jgi:hypothetical protein
MASLGRIEETPYLYGQPREVYNADNKTIYLNSKRIDTRQGNGFSGGVTQLYTEKCATACLLIRHWLWESIVPHIAIIAGFATSYESNSNELSLCSRVIQLSSQTNASLAFSDPRAF